MVSAAVQNPLSPGCEVTPEWNVKLTRKAFHITTSNVSVLDLTHHLEEADTHNDTRK